MAYTTINKSTDYFNTKLYTGNSGTQSITGVGFQPDWVWIKRRDATANHQVFDAVRGATKRIMTDVNNGESTQATMLTAFGTDGFTVGSDTSVNNNTSPNVSWNWKANGQGSSNTDGSINTTYTSVNTTAGFSICQYTGTGSNATVGHGLGVAPKMVIVKKTSGTSQWYTYHASIGATKYLDLESNAAESTSSANWNDTAPTNNVFSLGTNSNVNASGQTYIAYVFAEKTGYSKFGSYTGNGNADGTFIYTGFKPAWIMVKRTDAVNNWIMLNNKMSLLNNNKGDELYADVANQQNSFTDGGHDFLSNGFKARGTNASINYNGGSYIYMCFASAPLVGSNNVPCTAR